ncbi:methylated-DNA--[protein]-cysteine S-methyltransferase [Actinacidiphila epipremni]|jgi:methylated-DNA-[protein]-cysteine S-methyltransferase|uniref:Methylated-DNA--protein-cysteine methyltransferase n=1 Tax=Actinacidiphila epipremni TaxID=2053013 RepID=A0ABX0ZP78_9ACTN|nr:methylated-DNA--[protein]-cysteine S-methyltransferase [Actinacidiphila epipremni]NJP45710.1 methylated-DNA--[protein]-cysteine S-methyltransferase [Actinacidiphila epipremni]
MTTSAAWTVYDAPIGPLLLVTGEQGLVLVGFRADPGTAARTVAAVGRRLGCEPVRDAGPLAPLAVQLEAYFAGELKDFDVDLDWSLVTGFQRRVLRELAAGVPYGTVVGYQDLADRVGEPDAARAVGAAMGANPLPVVVPCHRVVESGGGIGGFGGGLEIKRSLLALEGVLPAPLF